MSISAGLRGVDKLKKGGIIVKSIKFGFNKPFKLHNGSMGGVESKNGDIEIYDHHYQD